MESSPISSEAPRPQHTWRPGSRITRLSASHSYVFVLVLILATFIFLIAAPDESWSQSVVVLLESAMLGVALWVSGLGMARPALVLFAFGMAVAAAELAGGGRTVTGLVGLLDFALAVATVVVIGLGVVDQREINRQSISGAICIYLLLGILFTFLFGAIAELGSGDFFAQGTDGTPSLRIYFSYVTLATLGYGDYTAAGELGRSMAIAEAGQLYLVTVVALLVGHFGQRRRDRA